MMKIIENELNILFLFDIEELNQIHSFNELGIKLNNKIMSMNYFINNLNEFKLQLNYMNKLNDEWLRICIYLLNSIGYKITFTKDSLNYFNYLIHLNKLNKIEFNEKERERKKFKEYFVSLSSLQFNEFNSTISMFIINESNELIHLNKLNKNNFIIKSIQKKRKVIQLTNKNLNKNLNEFISLINKESKYEIICNEECIPHYLQLKQKNQKKRKYFANEFINEFNVNEKIENLIENQFYGKKNEIEFPRDYLIKRFDDEI